MVKIKLYEIMINCIFFMDKRSLDKIDTIPFPTFYFLEWKIIIMFIYFNFCITITFFNDNSCSSTILCRSYYPPPHKTPLHSLYQI